MKHYTKLCLATLFFISSVPAFADGYKGEAPPLVPVSIPSFNGGFEATLGALYMTPASSNTDYLAVYHPDNASINSIESWRHENVNPSYDGGLVFGLGYVIPNTANDIKLDWMRFHNDYNDSQFVLGDDAGSDGLADVAPGPQAERGRVFFVPLGAPLLRSNESVQATGNMDYAFDAIDLTMGQYINMGSRLQTRLFAGLRYVHLESDLSTSYSHRRLVGGATPSSMIQDYALTTTLGQLNSSFNGLGPLLGIKADYYLGAGFALSGVVDAALLVGQVSLDGGAQVLVQSFSSETGIFTDFSRDSVDLDWGNNRVISPGFDAKLGMSYKYQFNNGAQLGLELGYQVSEYIDVIEQLDLASPRVTNTPGTVSIVGRQADISNFRLTGPYLTLNVKV